MIPADLFNALCCGAREAVKTAWDDAHSNTAGAPNEVAHIYAMTSTGVQTLGELWGPILQARGIELRVTGVFSHQTPKATYIHPEGERSPELSDILIVHEHKAVAPSGVPTLKRRAVLIQAKMADKGLPGGVDRFQEYLYQHWPEFELKGLGPKGKGRFLPGRRHIGTNRGGSRYGLIERTAHSAPGSTTYPYCCGFPWTFSAPLDPIRSAGGEDAGSFIANMLFESSWPRGRSCAAVVPALALGTTPDEHFAITIEELLTLTALKTVQFAKSPWMTGHRGVTALCWQTQSGIGGLLPATGRSFMPSGGGRDEEPTDSLAEDDDDGATNVLLLETGGEEG